MKSRYIFIGVGIIAFCFLFYYMAWSFSPGSYARAEVYEVNTSEETLIEIINEVKSENNMATNTFSDSEHGHWFSIYFEYRDKDQIIHTLTRPKSKTTTHFYFSGYKYKAGIGNWTNANEHFWWWKNTKAKKEFEDRILNKVEEKIKKRKQ